MSGTYHDLYTSDLQTMWSLWVVPVLLLVWLRFAPAARERARSADSDVRFVHAYTVLFTIETLADSVSTGPLSRALGIADTPAGTGVMLLFVLLGDFRVLLLLFRLGRPERPLARTIRAAALWTVIVPVIAFWMDFGLRAAFEDLPGQTIWLVYELAFLGLALFLRNGWIPEYATASDPGRRAYLRAAATYAAVYYALWASADVAILVFGRDEGWALRIVPNQLYYVFWTPFVYFSFFSRRYASAIASTQISR